MVVMKDLTYWIQLAVSILETCGALIILLGTVLALGRGLWLGMRQKWEEKVYRRLRINVGRAILLGLELLVAADIIRTVGLELTIRGVLVLGLIVFIRTFLSFVLEVEMNGRWPWQGQRREKESV
jgi:uncharacterized membrane protein